MIKFILLKWSMRQMPMKCIKVKIKFIWMCFSLQKKIIFDLKTEFPSSTEAFNQFFFLYWSAFITYHDQFFCFLLGEASKERSRKKKKERKSNDPLCSLVHQFSYKYTILRSFSLFHFSMFVLSFYSFCFS